MLHATRVFVLAVLLAAPSVAATIEVTPSDSYTKIEAAKAGDEVVIAPGTYRFRVYLTTAAPANAPILIHAKDPANPPIWDLSAGNVEDAPGSYTAGDRGRGCWQLSGASNIQISNIVITGCHNAAHNSAGLRYYASATGIRLNHVVFHDNDNGLTGGTEGSEITVESCEFARNGSLLASSSAPSHNIYVYGGTFTLRYSYVHDPIQAQNFHIRAKNSMIEYNWFSRAKSYAGDLMTDDDSDGVTPSIQDMYFRGNVIVQGTTQANTSQIIAVYNDAGASNLSLNIQLLYNTFVGNGGRAALVHLSNADGTTMSAVLQNNIIYGTTTPVLVEDAAQASVSGSNNWLVTGATATGLTGSVFGADPSFKNAAQNDFTLAAGSTAIGKALDTVKGLPTSEYYQNESVTCSNRPRSSAKDIGAFESTTQSLPTGGAGGTSTGGAPSGGSSATNPASGGSSDAQGGAPGSGGSTPTGAGGATSTAAAGGANDTTAGDSGGCSCAVPGRTRTEFAHSFAASLFALLVARCRRRSPRRRNRLH